MTHYSVQTRDRIYVKVYEFLSFAKKMGRNVGKKTSKNLSCKCSQNLFIMLHNLLQMHLKLLQKKQFKKQKKQLAIWLEIKIADEITRV